MKINTTDVRTAIYHSLQQWQSVSLLTFKEEYYNENADIKVSFVKGKHNDGWDFDGKGRILAHAFFPSGSMRGVVHLDYDEDWDFASLKQVLLHELGHTFGLGHSSDNKSIMFPWYSSSVDNVNQDDKNGIEWLYGLKNKWAKLSPPVTTQKPILTTIQPTPPVTTTQVPIIQPRFGNPTTYRPTTRHPFQKIPIIQPRFGHSNPPIRYNPKKTNTHPLSPPFKSIPNSLLNVVNSSITNLYVYFPNTWNSSIIKLN